MDKIKSLKKVNISNVFKCFFVFISVLSVFFLFYSVYIYNKTQNTNFAFLYSVPFFMLMFCMVFYILIFLIKDVECDKKYKLFFAIGSLFAYALGFFDFLSQLITSISFL